MQRKIMFLQYIPTEDQDTDILTKALTRRKFEYHRGRIKVKDNPYLVEIQKDDELSEKSRLH